MHNFISDKNSCQHAKDYELITIRTNDSGLEVHTLFPEYYYCGSSRASQRSDSLFPITVCLQGVVINYYTFDTKNF